MKSTKFSSFVRRMSDSGSDNPQFFAIEKQDDREGITKLGNSSEPQSENRPEAETADEKKGNLDRADHQKEQEEFEEEEEESDDKATVSCRESEKQISEDDDGFKTPTSSDHRIPAIIQCPPAPKKPLPQPSKFKRKASPPPPPRRACHSLQFDGSTQVESIFRPIPNDQDDPQQQKIKKARTDDKDQS